MRVGRTTKMKCSFSLIHRETDGCMDGQTNGRLNVSARSIVAVVGMHVCICVGVSVCAFVGMCRNRRTDEWMDGRRGQHVRLCVWPLIDEEKQPPLK